jgi:hypothetical protein
MSGTRIALAIPADEGVKPFWAHDYARMLTWTTSTMPGLDFQQIFCVATEVVVARARILRAVLEDGGFSHLLWLDTDMRFPKDTLVRWLPMGAPMLCANYTRKKSPHDPVAWKPGLTDYLYTERDSHGLERAGACGMGVCLMNLDELKGLKEPYFMLPFNPATRKYMGEDVYFCQKVTEMGLPVMVDHDLSKEVAHIGDVEFSYEHALWQREANEKAELSEVTA